ncbi:hypothetical protein [Paracoccus mutanolyticus]|uniref:hypothetical protein n=1 Tax=Paracoccus mutanolyticus TaxID=1499308 RepID=UPI0021D53891|nr:hypothetical protein [Paracoccus mutanolyticus]
MADWYRAAGICVTCGSLVDHGGHTPWEPAAWRCAVLHGPHVANHARDYADLAAAGGALAVTAQDLGAALAELAQDGERSAAWAGPPARCCWRARGIRRR